MAILAQVLASIALVLCWWLWRDTKAARTGQRRTEWRLVLSLVGLLALGGVLLIGWWLRRPSKLDWESGQGFDKSYQTRQQVSDMPACLPPSWPLAWLSLPQEAVRTSLPQDPYGGGSQREDTVDGADVWEDKPWGYRQWQVIFYCEQDWMAVRAHFDQLCYDQQWLLADCPSEEAEKSQAVRQRSYVSRDGFYSLNLWLDDRPETPLTLAWRGYILDLHANNAPFYGMREVQPITLQH